VKTGVHLRRLLAWLNSTERRNSFRRSRAPWSWQPTTQPMSKTSCWPNADGGSSHAHSTTPRRRELIEEIELEPADPAVTTASAQIP